MTIYRKNAITENKSSSYPEFKNSERVFFSPLVLVLDVDKRGCFGLIEQGWMSYYNPNYKLLQNKQFKTIRQLHKSKYKKVEYVTRCNLIGSNEFQYFVALAGYLHQKHYEPFGSIMRVESMQKARDRISLIIETPMYYPDKIRAITPLVAACWEY